MAKRWSARARWSRRSPQEPVVGEVYEGLVKSTTAFGAFVEILPGTEALLHISEMRHGRTERTEDVVKKGDRVKVKLIDRDERGRLRLSMKALQPKPEGEATGGAGNGSEPRRDRGDRGDRGSREPVGAAAAEGDEPSYSRRRVAKARSGESTESTESTESSARGERGDRPRRPRGRGGRGGRGGRDRE